MKVKTRRQTTALWMLRNQTVRVKARDDECAVTSASGWKRTPFIPLSTTFKGDDYDGLLLGEDMPSPYGYFSGYVRKSAFLDLALRTNKYSVLQKAHV